MTQTIAEQDLFGFTAPSHNLPAGVNSGIIPLYLRDASRFLTEHHRHHKGFPACVGTDPQEYVGFKEQWFINYCFY